MTGLSISYSSVIGQTSRGTRYTRYKINDYGLVFVNFNYYVHWGELIIDEPYMLTSQVDQVFYVEDERNP